ncbi:hypothetical protein FRC10_008159, partial [Ceratobasidium sp. 414]
MSDCEYRRITAGYDQQACLSALAETLQHEELILLAQRGEPYCPAKQRFISKTITFDNLFDLGQTLFERPTSAEPIFGPQAGGDDGWPQDSVPMDPIPSQEERSPSITEPTEISDMPTRAAKRIQQWWRRHRKQRYPVESSIPGHGAQPNQHLGPISKHIVRTSKRNKLFRNVLRGPGLPAVLTVEMLGEQLGESLYTTHIGLQTPNVDGRVVEPPQKHLDSGQVIPNARLTDCKLMHDACRGFHKIAETLRGALSADSQPEARKPSNLSIVKTLFTQKAKAMFG